MARELSKKHEKDSIERFDNIEKRIDDIHKMFKIHLTSITIILAIAAVILTYLSFSSKSEVKDAIEDMERKFNVLSKEALKAPQLEILYGSNPINGRTIEVNVDNNNRFEFDGVVFKNIGDGITKFISFKLFFSENIKQTERKYWDSIKAYESKYELFYAWGGPIPVSPNDYFGAETFKGELPNKDVSEVYCKLEVFYGKDLPAVSEFVIKFVKAQKQ